MRGPVVPSSDRSAAPSPVAHGNEVHVNGGERRGVPFQQEPAAPGSSDTGGSRSPSSSKMNRALRPAMAPPAVLAQAQGLAAAEGQQQQQQRSAAVRGISSAAAPALATVAGHANNSPTAVVAQGGPSRLPVTSDSDRSRIEPSGAALGASNLVGVDGAVNGINKLQLQPPAAQQLRRPTGSSSSRGGARTTSSGSGSISTASTTININNSNNSSSGQALQRVHPGVSVEQRLHHQQQLQQQQYHQQQQQHQQQQHQRRSHGSVGRKFSPAPRTSRQQDTSQLLGGGGSGASWLVNSSGRPVAPADGGSVVSGAGSASTSPVAIINSSPRKRLPVPMAVASGTPTIYPACQECRELVKARLDEPVLLCEDRHRPGVFDTTSSDGGADGAEGASGRQQQQQQHQQQQQLARKRGSTWRLRERTTTFHLGLILCLNIGELYFCIFGTRAYSFSSPGSSWHSSTRRQLK